MADKALQDFVEPVPESMLEGKTTKEQHEIARGHRAFTRLKQQEHTLATQAHLKTAVGEQHIPKPQRRVPHKDPHQTIKVNIPKALLKTPTGQPSLAATSGLKPSKAMTELLLASAETGKLEMSKKDRLATTELKKVKVIKNSSPTERIGILYTPTANIRTTGRNDGMRTFEYQVSYRNLEPPPPPRPELKSGDVGATGKDPMLSHFLPLEEFDDEEYESHAPQEWLAMGEKTGGTPARSKYFIDGGSETQMPCRVIGYDEITRAFKIRWNHTGKEKFVKRLNLIFDQEDEHLWRERHDVAQRLRAQAEAQIRLQLYVEGMDDAVVLPVDEDQVDRILSLVAAEFPLQHLHVVEKSIAEMREMHSIGCKRAIHNYLYRSPEERQRLAALMLGPPEAPPAPSLNKLLGTIDTPSPNFAKAKSYIEENLFQSHALLHPTVYNIHARWSQFEDHLLCDHKMKGVPLPCELYKFEEHQCRVGTFVSERLKEDWSQNVITHIQNELDTYFNFFEENRQRYESSRMFRFCKMINMMMCSQLRHLLVRSCTTYTDFLVSYAIKLPDDFDEKTDVVEEIEEDRAEREYWEAREREVTARRKANAPPPPADADKKKKKAPKKAEEAGEVLVEGDESPDALSPVMPPQERVLEFPLFRNPTPYSRRILEMTQEPNGFEPLLVIQLISNGSAVMFKPFLEEVEDKVKEVFDNFFKYTDETKGLGDQLFPLLGLEPYPLKEHYSLEHDDPVIHETKQRIHRVLLESQQGPRQLQQMYQSFEYILQVDTEELCDSFRKRSPPATHDDYDNALERLARDKERVRHRTLGNVKFEFIKVECDPIKKSLMTCIDEISKRLLETLAEHEQDECDAIIQAYTTVSDKIGVEPQSPEELQKLFDYVHDVVPKELEQLAKTFDSVTMGYDLLKKYNFEISPAAFKDYWDAFEWPKTVGQQLDDFEYKYKDFKAKFLRELSDNTARLQNDITALAAKVDQLSSLTDATTSEIENNKDCIQLAGLIEQYQQDIARYNSHEDLFHMQRTAFGAIKEIKAQFEPYAILWSIAAAYSVNVDGIYKIQPVQDLDPDEIETNVNDWSRKLKQVAKKFTEDAPRAVCSKLQSLLETFKPQVPLIRAMRAPFLPRQKQQIRALLDDKKRDEIEKSADGQNWPDGSKNITAFVEAGLLNNIRLVEEFAESAQKSQDLNREMDKMEKDWQGEIFETEPYKDTKTYKIKAKESTQQLLDDQIQRTQIIRASPYLQHNVKLQTRAPDWEKMLLNIQTTLEEWFKCQGTWSYLQPIFDSPDIQKALPDENRMFESVDDTWRSIMDDTLKITNVRSRIEQDEELLKKLQSNNEKLELILKALHAFLETKRMAFPRFYFISPDELLKILSDSKDPFRVQPYLGKCFEGIKSVQFTQSTEIVAMDSAEGEKVDFIRKVNPASHQNRVELWLTDVESVMCDTIRDQLRRSRDDYRLVQNHKKARPEWIKAWPGQVVLGISCLFWTMEAEEHMALSGREGLQQYHKVCKDQLTELVMMVRETGLGPVERMTLEALVVIEVHAKDVIGELVEKKVESERSFDWQAQLRYEWREEKGTTGAHLWVLQINAALRYGYEYLGNTGRLVITPLTDRCYRTLMGALHLNYGGAPEGPAGTGKTETTKDLGKALAKQCVVYNCSDQISYKDMAKLFKGLAQAGAWGCFDEFNRIEVQVLSVIAQQVADIQRAIAESSVEFMFDGSLIKLKQGSAVFITMNPGYAGRAELPDNLKALFRPVAMMVPNYAMIGEIQLYSYGYIEGKALAEKIVATYRLCSEQLSSQDHYDYGMRAVKAVLTAAGRLKRKFPDTDEKIIMLRSIQDVNLPKFLTQDVELFRGIISDLFPGVVLPTPDYDAMTTALASTCAEGNLQMTEYFKIKVFETYEMIVVRHGMMLVGLSYSGKTKALHSLSKALGKMRLLNPPLEEKTRITTLNPKSVTLPQLYGKTDEAGEWTDGVLSNCFRECAQDSSRDRKWLVLDGPVDAVWIENMNTVLDDNKKLCLTNGDIIPMNNKMNMIFEVGDLQHASPATVSRCGMVYYEPDSLGWRVHIDSYLEGAIPEMIREYDEPNLVDSIREIINWLVDPLLFYLRRNLKTAIEQGATTAIASFVRLFDTFMDEFRPKEGQKMKQYEPHQLACHVQGWCLFSLTWALGGSLYTKDRILFNTEMQSLLQKGCPNKEFKLAVPLPDSRVSFFDVTYNWDNATKEPAFIDWTKVMKDFDIPATAQYHEIFVPTSDTERYSFLVHNFVTHNTPCLLVGDTGTGKTVMVKQLLNDLDKESFVLNMIQFSAQTSANQTQDLLESKADVRRGGKFGPRFGTKCVVFVDDLNMPALEEYGAQPPIELMRQWQDHEGWYNHKKDDQSFRRTIDLLFLCAMGPPGGGRNPITARLTRHFNTIAMPSFDERTMKQIFKCLMDWILTKYGNGASLAKAGEEVVDATIAVYEDVCEKMKPTPVRSHYTFNLRDVSKIFQGIAGAHAPRITDKQKLFRLWTHEVFRAIADRFIDEEDTQKFKKSVMAPIMQSRLKMSYEQIVDPSAPLLFTDVVSGSYEEVDDISAAYQALSDKVDEMKNSPRGGADLVIFNYVIEHVARIARILKQPFGHALLIGVGGSGRTSCTKLACKMMVQDDQEMEFFTLQVAKGFGRIEFRERLKELLEKCGKDGMPYVFYCDDKQIVQEVFLEDICNLLNTGEIPGLFKREDLDPIINARAFKELLPPGVAKSAENLQALFLTRCRVYLHIVMGFSPVGNTLRERLRQFPSLISCTTIDWFREWPQEGLRNVAFRFLAEIDLQDDLRESIGEIFVQFQESVRKLGITYMEEARQMTYVTPTSYLELLSTFSTLLEEKRQELTAQRDRYDGGLKQLSQTSATVDEMKDQLTILQPKLEASSKEVDALIARVSEDSAAAQVVRDRVAAEEAKAMAQAAKADEIKKVCEERVNDAMPALLEAKDAAQQLDPKMLNELKALNDPPGAVKVVIEACCELLGGQYVPALKRDPATGKTFKPYWEHARKVLLTPQFKDTLLNWDVEEATEAQISFVEKNYINKPDVNFNQAYMQKKALAVVGVVAYVVCQCKYYRLNKEIKPLLSQRDVAVSEYEVAMADLSLKKAELAKVDAELKEKEDLLNAKNAEKQALIDKVNNTALQLQNAKSLMEGLGGEKKRYADEAQRFRQELSNVVGDVVLSAGQIAYLGPFQSKYRESVLSDWLLLCHERKVPGSKSFSFEKFMGKPLEIQAWKMQELPSDNFSVENAIMFKNSRRWPLLIDPQEQANKWIKNFEKPNNIVVCRPTEDKFVDKIATAVRQGLPCLLENVGEELDPVLEDLLLKKLKKEGAHYILKIGDEVQYNDKFRFYMTTKIPKPHYRPEVSTKVNLINFVITPNGLRDQLLSKVVREEDRASEAKKESITKEMAALKIQLKETEDIVLRLLCAEGNILENQEAVEQLQKAKEQSDKAAKSEKDAIQTEKNVEKSRQQYVPCAQNGAQLFFCVTEMANIDPMYQYSLQFYLALFMQSLKEAPKPEGCTVAERVEFIKQTFQKNLYTRICRGLFAKDQLLFSFIMCLKMKEPDPMEIRWMLLGGFDKDSGLTKNPYAYLPDLSWKLCWRAFTQLPGMKPLEKIMKDRAEACEKFYRADAPLAIWDSLPDEIRSLDPIKKLIFIRCFRPDKMVLAVSEYVETEMDRYFVEPPIAKLSTVCEELETDPAVPIIFILSAGADPNAELDQVAREKGHLGDGVDPKKLGKLSLGQGQDKFAVKMIEEGKKQGNWVLLQNCHLYKDFMPALARIIEQYSLPDERDKINREYRLFLTSMPAETFPVSVLQNGAKLVQEPPKGMRANLRRSFMTEPISNERWWGSVSPGKADQFKRLLFGLCFFHSLVQERRKFGPLGFNIPYEFNDMDMRISVKQLLMFIEGSNDGIPYEAITYLTGHCNYGGRVTDDWDRRCLMAILATFFTERIHETEPMYLFAPPSDLYYAPVFADQQQYIEYIESLPLQQDPGVFGLHLNADITKDERDTRNLMDSVLLTQPRDSGGGSKALDPKDIVLEIAADLARRLPKMFQTEDVQAKYPLVKEQSMNTVLLQELIRYNRLLAIVSSSTANLQKAIRGEVVMSAELDTIFNAMYNGKVPPSWKKRSFPSLKPFGSYVNDLLARLEFLQKWIDNGPPSVFWISGFFFTQSFLTGVMQNYARKTNIEIDKLFWEFTVMDKDDYPAPEDGCFIKGLFLEGAGWDPDRRVLKESENKKLFIDFPIIYMMPKLEKDLSQAPHYRCPCYKTTDRRGVLATTGHSTNFVLVVKLPRSTEQEEDHWVKRGAALFTQLEY